MKKLKAYLSIFIRLVIVLGVIFAAVSIVDFNRFASYISKKIFLGMILCQPIILIGFVPTAFRLAIFSQNPSAPFFPSFRAICLSLGLNFLLPARLSELIKPVYLKDKAGIPLSNGLGAVFLERATDLIFISCLALSAVGIVFVNLEWRWVIGLLIMLISGLSVFTILKRPLLKMISWLPFEVPKVFLTRLVCHTVENIRQGRFYVGVLLGILVWVCSIASVIVFINFAGRMPMGFAGSLGVFISITFARMIPGLPSGFGAFEAAATLVFKHFGYNLEEALALAIGLHMSQLILPVLMAALIFLTEHIGVAGLVKSLKDISVNAKRQDTME